MYIHQQTRCKNLTSLNLSISYDRVSHIETSIENDISSNAEEKGGIYVPPNICKGAPAWSNLYTSLKLVQGINVSTTGNNKAIITLDLQLYAKCMQLREEVTLLTTLFFVLVNYTLFLPC